MNEDKQGTRMFMWCFHLCVMLLCVFWLSANFVACGDPPKAETTNEQPAGDAGGGGDAGTADEGKKTWAQMSFDEKRAYMAAEVMPVMKKLFQEYDSTKYAKFGCATCHGADMADRKFAMPNTVYPLKGSEINNEDAKWLEFMRKKVQPEMAKLMGTAKYSCFGCHATKK